MAKWIDYGMFWFGLKYGYNHRVNTSPDCKYMSNDPVSQLWSECFVNTNQAQQRISPPDEKCVHTLCLAQLWCCTVELYILASVELMKKDSILILPTEHLNGCGIASGQIFIGCTCRIWHNWSQPIGGLMLASLDIWAAANKRTAFKI